MEIKIKVKLDEHVRECDHCGAKNIKRTFHIVSTDHNLYVGRICIQNITNINTSGNPHRARSKIEEYLNTLEYRDFIDLIDFEK